VLFAFTKADKLNKTKREEQFAASVRTLEITPDQAIAFSALNGEGRDELLETLGALLFPPPDEAVEESEGSALNPVR
jgi:GTP-binding protein EngB required for normal cell division